VRNNSALLALVAAVGLIAFAGRVRAIDPAAATGYTYVTSGAGAPTGTPASATDGSPVYWDTVHNQFYILANGWRPIGGGLTINATGLIASGTILTYPTPAADGDYQVSAQLQVSAATTLATTLTCAYTDVDSQSQTLVMVVQNNATAGAFAASGAITASSSTPTYSTPVMHIRVKGGTTITVSTTTGTFTGVTYSCSVDVRRTAL
jgi:hypothetical protein